MKRTVLRIIAAAIALASLLALSSCATLDRAKEHHMKYKDETKEEIEFDGKTYRLLPETKYGLTAFYLYCGDGDYCVTESDVPVLLSRIFGSSAEYDAASDVIRCREYIEDSASAFGVSRLSFPPTFGRYYCAEENFDKYTELLNGAELTKLRIDRGYYSEEGDFETLVPELPAELTEQIFGSLTRKNKLSEDEASDVRIGAAYLCCLLNTDETGTVYDPNTVEVHRLDDSFYLIVEDGIYRLSDKTASAITEYLVID